MFKVFAAAIRTVDYRILCNLRRRFAAFGERSPGALAVAREMQRRRKLAPEPQPLSRIYRSMSQSEASEVRALRIAFRRQYPAISDRVEDAELAVMLNDCRERLGQSCTPDKLIECAVAKAADIASERALGELN